MSTTKQDSKQFPPSVDIEPKIAPQEVVLSGATSFHSVYKFGIIVLTDLGRPYLRYPPINHLPLSKLYLYYSAEIIYEIYELYLVVGEKNAFSFCRFTFHQVSHFYKMHCPSTVITINWTICYCKTNIVRR